MGLRQVFTASEPLWYRTKNGAENRPIGEAGTGGGDPDCSGGKRWGFGGVGWFGGASYHAERFGESNLYGEAFDEGTSGAQFGIWAHQGLIYVVGTMDQGTWPSWSVSLWVMDAVSGEQLRRLPTRGDDIDGFASPVNYAPEVLTGDVWAWATNGAPHKIDTATGQALATVDGVTRLPWAMFEFPSYINPAGGFSSLQAFAADLGLGRAYAQWGAADHRRVSAYELGTDETGAPVARYLHDLWAASAVKQVLMTETGLVYVVDASDWLHVWDERGRYQGSVRNPRTVAYPYGFRYAWDRERKRLLLVPGTADAADGACTVTVKGFYPVVEPAILTPPIQRRPLRRGKVGTVLAHVAGAGGEPVGGVGGRLLLGGAQAATAASDAGGDLVFRVTPAADGDLTAGVEAPWP